MHQLQDRIEVIKARSARGEVLAAPPDPALPSAPAGNVSISLPVAAPSPLAVLPSVFLAHFIPANIKAILEGKDVNLASLLIVSQDVTENKSFACGKVSVVLKNERSQASPQTWRAGNSF